MKTRMKKLLAGMCAVLILPIGSAQTVLAEEPEQNFPISVEKAVNQTLKLWYGSPAKINTAESSGGEWMQQSASRKRESGKFDFRRNLKRKNPFQRKNTLDRRSFIEPSQLPVRK